MNQMIANVSPVSYHYQVMFMENRFLIYRYKRKPESQKMGVFV